MIRTLARIAAATLSFACVTALAQPYPNKPVKVVVPFAAGGAVDILTRVLAEKLGPALGQQIVVEPVAGAGGNLGSAQVAQAAPDGYTLLMATTGTHTINPGLYKNMPFDAVKDFAPITLAAAVNNILVVHPSVPVKNVKELVALARKRPNDLAYASSGNGSGGHLAAELLKSMTGIQMLHVPYKGGGPALVDLISGQVQVLFTTWASGRGHIQSWRIRALAVSTAKRPQAIPGLPTVAESGIPGYDAGVWYAVLAPAGTPPAIIDRLNREMAAALERPDYAKLLRDSAIDPLGSTPAELGAYIRSEISKWAKVVREAGVHID